MQRTRSAPPATRATSSGDDSGLNATPACSRCSRASRIVAGTSATASKWKVTLSPPAAATAAKYFAGLSTIKWTSTAPPWRCTIGEIDCSTIGPIVTGSTKWPSPTSKWKIRHPASQSVSICSPRIAKFAAYNDGSISTPRIHCCHVTALAILRSEPGDEEPRRVVAVRHRQEELRTCRVRVLRPLVAERLDGEPRRVDDGTVLVRVERADGVDDRSARNHTLRRGPEQLELKLGQRLRAPAQIGPAGEHAETGARRVDERAVEPPLVERTDVGLDDADVRQGFLGQHTSTAGVDLDRGHLPVQQTGLAARRRARVEDAFAVARSDDEGGELRRTAHRPHPPGLDPVDHVRTRHVGRLPDRLVRVHLERGRRVLGAHELERELAPEVTLPHLCDPIRIGELERAVGKGRDEPAEALREPPHDGVRERHCSLAPHCADELDGVVADRVCRQVGPADLVAGRPERCPHGRIELPDRTLAELLDAEIDRADTLHGSVRDSLRKRAVSLVELVDGGGERAVGVRVVLEDAPHDLECGAPGRRDHLRPRRNSSYVIERRPSGWTTSGTNLPSSTRASHTVTVRPSSSARAPMCGDSARTRRAASKGSERSSRRSEAAIFSAYVAPSSDCGSKRGAGSTSSRSRAATSAARAYTAPALSSSIGNDSCAAMGPASSCSAVRWIVTPVCSSPARIARSTGAAPRQRGSSDGWTLSHRARSSRRDGM